MPEERTSKSGERLVRKHLWMYEEDMILIEGLFGSNIKTSAFVRAVLRSYIRTMLSKTEAARRPQPTQAGLERTDAQSTEQSNMDSRGDDAEPAQLVGAGAPEPPVRSDGE